jgi:hypothetical protein
MVCFGRHTITGLLRLQDRTQQDWTADYRLYAQEHFEEDKIFGALRAQVQDCLAADPPKKTVSESEQCFCIGNH